MAGDVEHEVVAVLREDGGWQAYPLPARLAEDLDALVAALRGLPGETGTLGLVNVADEFFVAVKVHGEDVRLLLSDITAAVAWDLARDVVERLDVAVPDEDEVEDVAPAGQLDILADWGVPAADVGAVLSDIDAYADEMLEALADVAGFGEAYRQALLAPR